MVTLYVNYMSGDFYVGDFETLEKAQNHYEKHKDRYIDYRGVKFGYPYATPIYVDKEEKTKGVKTMAKKKVEEKMEVMNAPSKEVVTAYKKDVSLIKRELGKVESSFLNIGFSLHRIYKSGGFACDGYVNIYEFAKDKFNLARGTTNNFINVVETFGKQIDGQFMNELDDKYKSFSSSQLIALLGYINRGGQELDCFTADMSVRDVKAKIKQLEGSTSSKEETEEFEKTEDGVEVVTPSKETRNVLISCNGKDDYDSKIDAIDQLICLMFAKSEKNVKIEIVAVEY